jgi:putative transposase
MSNSRKRHSPEFKAQAVLEALKERRSVNEIAGEMEVHPVQVSQWKKLATDGLSSIFAHPMKKGDSDQEKLTARLYQEIGQLKVELDWLKKKVNPARPRT